MEIDSSYLQLQSRYANCWFSRNKSRQFVLTSANISFFNLSTSRFSIFLLKSLIIKITARMSTSQVTLAEKTLKLYDVLSVEDIKKIHQHFQSRESGGLSYEEFRTLLRQFEIVYSEEDFHNVCLKIDLDRDNAIKWSEFVSSLYFFLKRHYEVLKH